MTPWEQQVAEALSELMERECDRYELLTRNEVVDVLAPRVAATIDAIARRDHLGCNPLCETCRTRALTALRGEES